MLESFFHFLRSLFDPEGLKELIRSGGPLLICAIVFVETGLFVGFFLPGDSLLITAGIFAAAAAVPVPTLLWHWLLPVVLCAIVGDQLGYWIGRSAGGALYKREDSLFFRKSHLQRAHIWHDTHALLSQPIYQQLTDASLPECHLATMFTKGLTQPPGE